MKSVLILVLSHDKPPYDKMVTTALETWDSVEVEGVQTLYYFDGKQTSVGKFIYVDVPGGLLNMGKKTLAAFEYAMGLQFDYLARIHSSIYCNKQALIEYVQTLPDTDVFAGALAESANGFSYHWGGVGFVLSRDVLQRIVTNKHHWQHSKYMEDESLSLLANWLSVPFSAGYAGAIDNMGDDWRCISYNGESISFTDFAKMKRLNHHFIRVKQDGKRWVDEFIMKELFKNL